MRRALGIARSNLDAPFGCVIVDGYDVVAEGFNDAERSPVLHGEMAAIIDLLEARPDIEREHLVLYTTAEPCPMCAGALYWCGIPRVVYGTSTETLKNLGWPHIDLSAEEASRRAAPVGFETVGGVLEAECDALFEEAAARMEGGT
jgi:tRNA(Arg) A34 adenosine deaminase TadA